MRRLKVTGARVTAFWGGLLAILLVLSVVGKESWFVIGLWLFAVVLLFATAALVTRANRRAPVHRGAVVLPTSAEPAMLLVGAFAAIALAYVYGLWFAVLVPVPLLAAIYLAARDRALHRRLASERRVDPAAPPTLASAGRDGHRARQAATAASTESEARAG